MFGFIGPNGAGKSTLIRTLLGVRIASSGTIELLGQDALKHAEEIRKKIGYLPSEVYYYDEMSSRKLLSYSARFYGKVDLAEIKRLADLFELDLDKKTVELSFGNKKKCALIQSVLHQPELLILDEPKAGVDPLMQNPHAGFALLKIEI